MEADNYASTNEFLATIRGSRGERGKQMHGPGDTLPDAYTQDFRIEVCRDRVVYKGSWNKLAVIAHEDDTDTMLNHALLQARRRGDLTVRKATYGCRRPAYRGAVGRELGDIFVCRPAPSVTPEGYDRLRHDRSHPHWCRNAPDDAAVRHGADAVLANGACGCAPQSLRLHAKRLG
jgi:hypothetical protein